MADTVEWLRGIAAYVARAQSRHIAGLLLHIRERCAVGNLRAGSCRTSEHRPLGTQGNKL